MKNKTDISESTERLAFEPLLGADFSSGDFVNTPPIQQKEDGALMCPVCGKEWQKKGSGYGFVLSGAKKHIGSCFEKLLKSKGLRYKMPYNMDKLAWELEKIAP